MKKEPIPKIPCSVSGKLHPKTELVEGADIREPILEMIQKECPSFGPESLISQEELNRFRSRYVQQLMEQDLGELDEMERQMLDRIARTQSMIDHLGRVEGDKRTFGQKMADRLAMFAGSWPFIGWFMFFLLLWVLLNTVLLSSKPFDPYPFILLNLGLSMVAALQAPIIMMSQRRQEERDRERAENDYRINLKAELGIRLLHEKMDHLINKHSKTLLEIQQVQLEVLEELRQHMSGNKR